jgi:hypothetical protein
MFDSLLGGLSSFGNTLSSMASDLSSGVSDFFSEDPPEYDEKTGKPLNKAAYEEEIAAATDAGDDEYADKLTEELDELKASKIDKAAKKLEGYGKTLDVSDKQKILQGRQIQAPDLMNLGRARGFGDIARLPSRYDVAGTGSYQQSGALEDLVTQGIKGLLSNAIRQNPYRRLI